MKSSKPLSSPWVKFSRISMFLFFSLLAGSNAYSQTKGLIYKPAEGNVLDPDGNGYTSRSPTGFVLNDEEESEISFTPIPFVEYSEPNSDLTKGPVCGFTDLVKSEDNNTVYTYLDEADNLMFRFRLGGTSENSKGYSILIDTDQKFGASGPNADPNYLPGNPGFEIEVVLMTNFGVGLFDVNGTTSPVEIGTATVDRPYAKHAQKSIALSEICGDDDYFYDFYIPFEQITAAFPDVTTNTPLRMTGNTSINPKETIGNNGISDIAGIDDEGGIPDNLWEDLIDVFPPTSADEIGDGATLAPRASCPMISGPIAVGATVITGSSTEEDGATIEVFKNGVSQGTTTVTGGTWSFSSFGTAVGDDVFSAVARVTVDEKLIKSNSYADCNVTVVGASCSEPLTGILEAQGNKKFEGTISVAGAYEIAIYHADGSLVASEDPNPKAFEAGISQWDIVYTSQGNKIPAGSYYFTIKEEGKCESAKTLYCSGSGGNSTSAIFDNSIILESQTSINGTATPGALVTLFIDDKVQGSVTAVGGTWSFLVSSLPNEGINHGETLKVVASEEGKCESDVTSITVSSKSYPPTILGDTCIEVGSFLSEIFGTSIEDIGATITVYESTVAEDNSPVILGTATVNSNGFWSLEGVAVSSGSYLKAKAQSTGELESDFSNEVEVRSRTSISGLEITSSPINEGDAVIEGTVSASMKERVVQLYIDESAVDGATTIVPEGTTEWSITGLDSPYNELYAGGMATVTISSLEENACESSPSSGVEIQCMPPESLNFAAITPTEICVGGTVNFQIENSHPWVVYELIDQDGNAVGPAKLGTGLDILLSSSGLKASVTGITVKAQKIGMPCERDFFPPIAISVSPLPTITLGSNPVVNPGATTIYLPYSEVGNGATQYIIDFDSSANAQEIKDISVPTPLQGSPVVIDIPAEVASGTYTANISVLNPDTGCFSEPVDFTLVVREEEVASSFGISAVPDGDVDEQTNYSVAIPTITGSPEGSITYGLGGADKLQFELDSEAGEIKMQGKDYENPLDENNDNLYEISITATDGSGTTVSTSWTVTVLDVSEFDIVNIPDAEVLENTPYTSEEPQLTGEIPEGGITYSLGGADAALFSLDPETGIVGLSAKDYEIPEDIDEDNVYEVSISASHEEGSATTAWTVEVLNGVEFIFKDFEDVEVPEGSEYTSELPELMGEDPIGEVTYSLGGEDSGLFNVDDQGIVSLPAKDYEFPEDSNADNIYEVNLIATDEELNTAIMAWKVIVTDQPEPIQFSIDDIEDATIAENLIYTSENPVLTGIPSGTVSYSLGGADAALFTINTLSGQVTLQAKDYEVPQDEDEDNVYEISIIATDSEGNTAVQSWGVVITDEGETVISNPMIYHRVIN